MTSGIRGCIIRPVWPTPSSRPHRQRLPRKPPHRPVGGAARAGARASRPPNRQFRHQHPRPPFRPRRRPLRRSTDPTAAAQVTHAAAAPAADRGDAGTTARPLISGLQLTFAKGQSDLSPTSANSIKALARAAPNVDTTTFNVLAYASGDPDDPSVARRMSLSRAIAVRDALMADGVPSARIYLRALGSQSRAPVRQTVSKSTCLVPTHRRRRRAMTRPTVYPGPHGGVPGRRRRRRGAAVAGADHAPSATTPASTASSCSCWPSASRGTCGRCCACRRRSPGSRPSRPPVRGSRRCRRRSCWRRWPACSPPASRARARRAGPLHAVHDRDAQPAGRHRLPPRRKPRAVALHDRADDLPRPARHVLGAAEDDRRGLRRDRPTCRSAAATSTRCSSS